jgi:DNA-binding MarR family transcriptional regulator
LLNQFQAMTAEPRPDVEVLDRVQAIAAALRGALADALPDGLSLAEFQLLQRLAWSPAAAPAELARDLRCSKAQVTAMLQRLVPKGLVAVDADAADGRRKRVRLTEPGLAALRGATQALRPQAQALRAAIPEAEFRAALPFLRSLSAALAGLSRPA